MKNLLQFSLSICLSCGVGFSQSASGTITGMVTDPSGADVPKAAVTCRNQNTNVIRQTSTDSYGVYRVANLDPGEYQVEVRAPGFRQAASNPVRLQTADVLRLDISLEVGEVTDSITVTAHGLEVNTADPQLGKSFREVAEIPLLSGNSGRNVLLLLGTQPGVMVDTNGGFSVNGQRVGSNSFALDGTDSTDVADRQPDSVNLLSPNAVAEVRLVTGVLKAEYGRSSGGAVIVMTKSGGNAFHGVAAEVFRNGVLNAVPFFSKSVTGLNAQTYSDGTARKPQWNGNDFDANLGGPIVKDRTFFFASYLGFRRRQGDSRSATVPSDAQRAAIEASGVPEAKALLALVPRAQSGNLFLSAPSNALDRDSGLLKIDHSFAADNQLSLAYFIDDQRSTSPFNTAGGSNRTGIPGFGTIGGARHQNVILRDSHAFSAVLLNEFRASFHRNADVSAPFAKASLRSLGLTGIMPDDPTGESVPFLSFAGFTGFGTNIGPPDGLQRNTWQSADSLTWGRGRHFWKFGGELLSYIVHSTFANFDSGQITLNGNGTSSNSPLVPRRIPGLPNDLNDFANGFASVFTQGNSLRAAGHTQSFGIFAQDDWKVRRNLTLNVGLRWEYNSPFTDQRDRFLTLRPGEQSSLFPDAPIGLVYPRDAGVSRSTYAADRNNFAPRIGFAWDLLGNGRLAIRGGYGLLYDNPDSQFGAAFLAAPPFNLTQTVISTRYADPWATSTVHPIPQPFPFQPRKPGEHFDFTTVAPLTLGIYDPGFATPYTQQWSVQIQRQLRRDWLLEASYVGSSSVRLLSQHQINPGILTPTASATDLDSRRVLNLGNPQNPQYHGAVFGSVISEATDANANFHSLQLNLVKRFAHGLQLGNAYTWGHSIDNASAIDWAAPAANTSRIDNARADRGNSTFDVRHRYVVTYLYELPRKNDRSLTGQVLGGWAISGITTLQTGLPFNITDSGDRCLCNSGGERPDFDESGSSAHVANGVESISLARIVASRQFRPHVGDGGA
jgi:outer membrane receptor protein involved in Fe transport